MWLVVLATAATTVPAITVSAADGPPQAPDARLQQILRVQPGGATSEIFQLRFSPDGKTLATGDADWNKPSDIVLWNTTTWKERARLKHTNEVLCIAFHPTKPIIAAGAWDKTVKVWDLN